MNTQDNKETGGRPIGTGGRENMLLGEIIEAIREDGFLGKFNSWSKIIKLLLPDINIDKPMTNSISFWKTNFDQKLTVGISDQYDDLKVNLAQALGFENKLWTDVDARNAIDIVHKFKKKYLDQEKSKVDISPIEKYKSKNEKLTEKENELLKKLKSSDKNKLSSFTEYKNAIKSNPSRNFLIDSINILYNKSAYGFIYKYIFNKLPDDVYNTQEIQILRAHICGTLEVADYTNAASILYNLSAKNNSNTTDNLTGYTSNLLRNSLLTTKNDELRNLFKDFTEIYRNIFQNNIHYYPGINYAYMLALGQKIFPKTQLFKEDTVENVYEDAKESIKKDKESQDMFSRYYGNISEVEFKALLNEKLDLNWIQDVGATPDMLMRTRRQIIFYSNTLHEHNKSPENSILSLSKKLKEIAEPSKSLNMQLQ